MFLLLSHFKTCNHGRYRDEEGNDVTPLPLYVPVPEPKSKKKKKV
jgi:hypothetical protein